MQPNKCTYPLLCVQMHLTAWVLSSRAPSTKELKGIFLSQCNVPLHLPSVHTICLCTCTLITDGSLSKCTSILWVYYTGQRVNTWYQPKDRLNAWMYNNGTNVIKQKEPVSLKSTKYSNAVQSQPDMAAGGKLIKPHCQSAKGT